MQQWKEAARAARKQIRHSLSPCSPSSPPQTLLHPAVVRSPHPNSAQACRPRTPLLPGARCHLPEADFCGSPCPHLLISPSPPFPISSSPRLPISSSPHLPISPSPEQGFSTAELLHCLDSGFQGAKVFKAKPVINTCIMLQLFPKTHQGFKTIAAKMEQRTWLEPACLVHNLPRGLCQRPGG